MRYLSLFSGIESASIAWAPLGWTCVGVAEIEPFPCKLLAYHYPEVPNLGSVTDITQTQIEALGHIDLVVFGAPCQDLSVAGKRKGMTNDDGSLTRSGLFFTAMSIAKWSRARFAIYENVPGMFSSSSGDDFAAVVSEMAGCRFDKPEGKDKWQNSGVAVGPNGLVEWVTLDAQFCRTPEYPRAVPQRRRRVFVVRDSGDWTSRPPLFLDSESLRGNPPPSRKTREEVARDIASSIGERGEVRHCLRSGDKHESTTYVAGTRSERTGRSVGAQDAACGHLVPSVDVGRSLLAKGNDSRSFDLESYVSVFDKQSNAEYGEADIASTMSARDYKSPTDLIAFTARDYGDASSGVAPTMRSLACGPDGHQNGAHGLAIALAGNTIGREPHNGGNGTGYDESGAMHTLTKVDRHAVAFNSNARPDEMKFNDDSTDQFLALCEVSDSMKSVNPASRCNSDTSLGPNVAVYPMQVRRLTPTECARLQGFPDDYLPRVPGYSDSAAYKALGNSFAVNVVQLIGQRIQLVEDIKNEKLA